MTSAIEIVRDQLVQDAGVSETIQRKFHNNRLAELGHPTVRLVDIQKLEELYSALASIGFIWKVLPESLKRLKYVAGFCLDERQERRGKRIGKRHSCVQTSFNNPVVYKGDIPDQALDNIQKVRSFRTKDHYIRNLVHFTVHSHEPLPVKIVAPGLVGRLDQVRNGIETFLEEVDPILVAWPVSPVIRTGSIGSNNQLKTIWSEYPGIVISTWGLEQD